MDYSTDIDIPGFPPPSSSSSPPDLDRYRLSVDDPRLPPLVHVDESPAYLGKLDSFDVSDEELAAAIDQMPPMVTRSAVDWLEFAQWRDDAELLRFLGRGDLVPDAPGSFAGSDAANASLRAWRQVRQMRSLDYERISSRRAVGSLSPVLSALPRLLLVEKACTMSVYPGGVKFRPRRLYRKPEGSGGRRGVVSGLSAASRRRLYDLLMRIDWPSVSADGKRASASRSFFLTLTYGRDYPDDWEVYKSDLRAYLKRLDRFVSGMGASIIWKLEYQGRGAPHFHLLLITERPLSKKKLKAWHISAWADLLADRHGYDEDYLQKVRYVHNQGSCKPAYAPGNGSQLMAYLSKYMAKEFDVLGSDGEPVQTGRVWGVWHKDDLPFGRIYFFTLTESDWLGLVSQIRMYGREVGSPYLASRSARCGFLARGDGSLLLAEWLARLPGLSLSPCAD